MAKKTRTELSTLAINTNLPDNTSELITPTTERAQLTDERESVVNYKDDLGGVPNAGKFLTVAVDGESLTMVDEPSGVPDWVTFVTAAINKMKLLSGSSSGELQFLYDVAGVDTLGAKISWSSSGNLIIGNNFFTAELSISNQFNFIQGGSVRLRIETTGDLTHNADIMALNAQQAFGNSPLYTFKFQGKVTGSSGGSYTFEELANIKGGKENATENDKAGFLSFTTGIADGTLTERLRISSGGNVGIGTSGTPAYLLTASAANLPYIASVTANIQTVMASDETNSRAYIGTRTNHPIAFVVDGNEKMRIESGGNVGIGTDPSSTVLLDLKEPDAATDLIIGLSAGTGARAQIRSIAQGNNTKAELSFHVVTSSSTSEAMRINQYGNLVFAGLGKGIEFNQSAGSGSVASSTLDAYEEGTWTPTIPGVITTGAGTYVRVGSIVQAWGRITHSSGTSNSNKIEGLPFSTSGLSRSAISFSQISGCDWGTGATMLVGFISTAKVDLYGNSNGNSHIVTPTTWFGSGDFVEFGLSYVIF